MTPLGAAPATNINYSLIDMAFQLIFHYLNEERFSFTIIRPGVRIIAIIAYNSRDGRYPAWILTE